MGGFLRFALPLTAFLSLFPLYTRYKAAAAPVPPAPEALVPADPVPALVGLT